MTWQDVLKRKKKKKSTVNQAGNYTKPGMRKRMFQRIKAGGKGGAPVSGLRESTDACSKIQESRWWLSKLKSWVSILKRSNPRIPRKKGQRRNSKKHSDLYTDEKPKGNDTRLGLQGCRDCQII